jgi:hypothetical protein
MSDLFVTYQNAPFPVLSEGIHEMNINDFKNTFAYNEIRNIQFSGLVEALVHLKEIGCSAVYIDGSYVTKKTNPGDFDACVDYSEADTQKLEDVFKDFSDGRKAQKDRYQGEFFPHIAVADTGGMKFLEFFQQEKYSGEKKGIVKIDLANSDFSNLGGSV